MFRLATALKGYREAGALNDQINLFGFVDDHTFLTKTGDVGVVLAVKGVDYECLASGEIDNYTKRLESAFKILDDKCRIYQYLFKGSNPAIPSRSHENPIVNAAIENRIAYLTQHVGQFTYLGQSFATIMIVWFGAKSALGSADRAGGFHFGNFASLIMMIAFGYAMTQYYDTPIPGFGRSFYHEIPTGQLSASLHCGMQQRRRKACPKPQVYSHANYTFLTIRKTCHADRLDRFHARDFMYTFEWILGGLARPEYAEELAAFYSRHYGQWGTGSGRDGQPVKVTPSMVRGLLKSADSRIAVARFNNELVGYAIALQTKIPHYGMVSWVTQLVVHEDHRRNNVGKTLLFTIWGFSNHKSWGLISANPYAIRALEKATRRRCLPSRTKRNRDTLLKLGTQEVPYIRESMEVRITSEESRINTAFFLDHSSLPDYWETGVALSKFE
jgi:hypothetical protein